MSEPGGILQFPNGVSLHTNPGDNQNVLFIYFGDIKDGEVESIPFLKTLLAEADKVIALNTMD